MASTTDVGTRPDRLPSCSDRLPDIEPTPPEAWYDRSSIRDDLMVMIPDQTEEDFYLYAPEKRFCEQIDGVVYMPCPVSCRHQELTGLWYILALLCGERAGAGTVLMGPAVLRVAPGRNLEPDLFVAPPGAQPLEPTGMAMGAALLVVEVLSSSNRSHDLKRKAAVYREARVPEIVFVDDRDKVLIVERLVGDAYETRRIEAGPWVSAAVDGLWLDVSWLWETPLPSQRECLDVVLAGPPAGA